MDKLNLDNIKIGITEKTTAESAQKSKIADLLNKDIRLFGSSFGDKKKERFYSEITILFAAGVDIKSALDLIEEEQEKQVDRELIKSIRDSVIRGKSLSAAMQATNLFSEYEVYSIKIGEESGRLQSVLQELSIFFSKKIKLKRQLVSALSYPVFVLVVAMSALVFMLNFVVPMFEDVFKRFKGELPYITRIVVKLSHLFSEYSGIAILGIILLFFLSYSQRKKEWFRNLSSKVLLRLPVMKHLIRKIYLARFSQSMSLLLGAKTPLLESIELVKKMIGFYPIERSLVVVREDILKGEALHKSLSQFSIFDKKMLSFIKVAEEVNQMDSMFDRLAKQYSDEVDHQTSLIGSLIEPFMIVFLGVLVGVILTAIYLPLFQMGGVIK